MDFSESDRVREVRQIAREFMKKEIYPLEAKLRHDGFAAVLPQLREKRAKAKETGLWAAHLPEEWGGAGLSLTEFAHLSEELGRSPLGHYVFTRRRGLGPPNCVQVVSRIAENRVNSGGLAWTRSCPQLGEVSEESSNDAHLPD